MKNEMKERVYKWQHALSGSGRKHRNLWTPARYLQGQRVSARAEES